jgi:hypothetical protein
MQPPGRNAHELYEQVLRLDPGNEYALNGIEEIAVRYIAMADSAISQTSYDNAENYLARAARLSPQRPELAAMQARLTEAKKSKSQVHALNPSGLSSRNLETMTQLAEIAHQLQKSGGTFLIRARNDEEGRWIYKVMREAVGSYRLRGNIDIAATPAVIVTIPPAAAKPATKTRRD